MAASQGLTGQVSSDGKRVLLQITDANPGADPNALLPTRWSLRAVEEPTRELASEANGSASFSDDGRSGFVTNQLAGSISIIDATTRTVKSTLPVGKKPNGIVFRSK